MKKLVLLLALTMGILVFGQETANRFIYELTYKPKKESDSLKKEFMVLDITNKDKSIYRDYAAVGQDSILKVMVEKAQRAGAFPDFQNGIKQSKFSYKIIKTYPSMTIQYVDYMFSTGRMVPIGYSEEVKFNWKLEPETEKIGGYEAHKATTEFGGRQWVAWYSTELPFPDGPYKFSGLPGLIVKIEDTGKNYSWVLQGNKPIKDYNELTYMEQMMGASEPKYTSKEKFESTFDAYKKDPFGSVRQYMTPQFMSQKMPGSNRTFGDMMKDAEKQMNELYNSIDNPIELTKP